MSQLAWLVIALLAIIVVTVGFSAIGLWWMGDE